MADVIDSGTRRTRKPHQCAYCATTILAGTTVRWWSWSDVGRAETSYAHDECSDAAHWEMHRYGLAEDDPLDPAEFRAETLPEYRREVASHAE